jgi:8-oxo-dGTP pyrophosphatase MutT (NUDIX family)
MQPEVFSSGYLVFRLGRPIQFLLMKHVNRWDLPKGHVDLGETSEQAALRELREETGIKSGDVWTDPSFVFRHQYMVSEAKRPRLKELTIYLAWLKKNRSITPTEHPDYSWLDWSPPHRIQSKTIDALLAEVAKYFESVPVWPPSEALRPSDGVGK